MDVRIALRGFRRAPGFAFAVVLILALSIGTSTAMFTIFKTVLVDRLPIAAQDHVVIMHPLDRSGTHLDVPETYLAEIARDNTLFRGVTGIYHRMTPQPFMNGDAVVVLNFAGASANYFDVLGVRPAVGRLFLPEDGQTGAPMVLVLSYAAWQRDFGGDPSVVGRSLLHPSLKQAAKIVGVAPAGFDYPSGADVWRAIPPENNTAQVDIIARLAPRATMSAAREAVFALTQRLNPFIGGPALATNPENFRISGVAAQSFADTVLGGSRPPIVALTVAVALLLLIACVNIGNLSLVRLLGRTREIAVRRAIGARSVDIVRLFAIESSLLGTLGGALGFVLAIVLLRLVRIAAPSQVPRLDALGSLLAPLTSALGVTLFALLIFGMLPSFVASRIQSYVVLRSGSRSGEHRAAKRARQWLVAMQIALAVVMLNGAGLLLRTLSQLQSVDLGYRADHLSLLSFAAPQGSVLDGTAGTDAAKALVRRLEATPGVVGATPILTEPFIGQSLFIMKLARAEESAGERQQNPFVPFEFVGPSYFRTLSIPIVRGRGVTDSDTRGSGRVAIVNETLAQQLWPNENAIGKRVVLVTGHTGDTTFTVVGVAKNTRFRELKTVGPVVYLAWEQVNNGFPDLVAVRTSRPLGEMLGALRAASRDINPALVLWKTKTMDQLLDAPLAQPRLSALLLAGFSVAALLLSAIGLYGVMAAGVRRQTHEIGVRMALGALPNTIRRLVIGQVFAFVGVGVIVGLGGALVTSRVLPALLFQVSPIDPLTLVAVCVLLVAVAMLAAYAPARRASRIDPIEALRAE